MRRVFLGLFVWLSLAYPALAQIGTPVLLDSNDFSTSSPFVSAGTAADCPANSLVVLTMTVFGSGFTLSTISDSGGNSGYAAAVTSALDDLHTQSLIWYKTNTTHDLPMGGTFTLTGTGFSAGVVITT